MRTSTKVDYQNIYTFVTYVCEYGCPMKGVKKTEQGQGPKPPLKFQCITFVLNFTIKTATSKGLFYVCRYVVYVQGEKQGLKNSVLWDASHYLCLHLQAVTLDNYIVVHKKESKNENNKERNIR